MQTVKVRCIENQAAGINTFEFVDPAGKPLPPFTAGAHIDVHLPGGFIRQYSLCNSPQERDRYVVGVLNVAGGRGGSRSLHSNVKAGDLLQISEPRNHFPVVDQAQRHLLIGGGIGVTPMMAMLEHFEASGAEYILYYCGETPERTAFKERLSSLLGEHVVIHYDGGDPARRLDIRELLMHHEPGTHLYCCGPGGLMAGVKAAAEHWPEGTVHFEHFAAPVPPPSVSTANEVEFQITLARSGQTLDVPSSKSIAQVLREAGLPCETSCEAGICGTCKTRFIDGEADHRDFILSDDEKQEHLLICCSRSKSSTLVLDL
ncbi:PDR/VanB family oxidoreductase [Pseudomonas sp. GD03860]|uniref:PDR/VanB family oxidoreductase n=1 Tax=Pseudomonas TaxID=286 RepID=UPI00236434D3|nr:MULTISPECIES: PDR/VanB family oxidoreductase [Pseudomonas]MDD2056647.1 PDR/VanB family oxidoreductase [Pseudomonas putida]MDH0638159.1 PDR/VanB family oxidoreductase [Pseudomonas sp. GD03860]